MKVGTGRNLDLSREYHKKLFGPLFNSWWNCPLTILSCTLALPFLMGLMPFFNFSVVNGLIRLELPRSILLNSQGGEGTQVQRGVRTRVTYFAEEEVFFKTSACPRFCERRVLFCTQVRSMGVKIPLQSTKYPRLWRRVTPEVTGLPRLLPPLAAVKHAEDYTIKIVFPFIQCQWFDKGRGVYLVEKVSVLIKTRVLFWPEISALRVFLNFDNKRMRPLKTRVPPPPPPGLNSSWLS